MDNGLSPSPRIPVPDDADLSARLSAIEDRLDEIIRRLGDLKSLLATLDGGQLNNQHSAEG